VRDADSTIPLIVDALARFGEVKLRVTGASMLPTIWPGDTLTIRRRAISDVHPGEVVLFSRDNRLFVHRVVAHNDSQLVTRGDSVPIPDPPVGGDQLLGVAISVARGGAVAPLRRRIALPARLIAAVVRRSSHASGWLLRLHASRGARSNAAAA